jgi:HPt (histidine-containing phosphotransfer) domain-containing protein
MRNLRILRGFFMQKNAKNLPLGDNVFLQDLANSAGETLTQELIDSTPVCIQKEHAEIKASLNVKDSHRLKDACHALKGACYSVKAERLSYYTRALEQSADDLTKAEGIFEDFEQVLLETVMWWQTVQIK